MKVQVPDPRHDSHDKCFMLTRSLSNEMFTVSHCGWSPTGSHALYNAMQRQAKHCNLLQISFIFISSDLFRSLSF